MKQNKLTFFPKLAATVKSLPIDSISGERKDLLQVLIQYIRQKLDDEKDVKLNFICTHNSRRSQFAQIWAQTAADYYGIEVKCHSGGVEVASFNERAVETIKGAGFMVTKKGKRNPIYSIFHSQDAEPISAFSKLYDDPINPTSKFSAIMTCSHADENCPYIPGVEARISLNYEDPKEYDGTPRERIEYNERSKQIATEMFYVFSMFETTVKAT
ncbi:MAG: protein-tyrosine-phosphatase [Cyclobacteriaceae bacterium]